MRGEPRGDLADVYEELDVGARTLRRVKNLEFAVNAPREGERIFHTFEEAAAFAISLSASSGGEEVNLDVLAWDRKAARAWGGDYGAEEYDADPDASVHDRIVVRAEAQGRVA